MTSAGSGGEEADSPPDGGVVKSAGPAGRGRPEDQISSCQRYAPARARAPPAVAGRPIPETSISMAREPSAGSNASQTGAGPVENRTSVTVPRCPSAGGEPRPKVRTAGGAARPHARTEAVRGREPGLGRAAAGRESPAGSTRCSDPGDRAARRPPRTRRRRAPFRRIAGEVEALLRRKPAGRDFRRARSPGARPCAG